MQAFNERLAAEVEQADQAQVGAATTETACSACLLVSYTIQHRFTASKTCCHCRGMIWFSMETGEPTMSAGLHAPACTAAA